MPLSLSNIRRALSKEGSKSPVSPQRPVSSHSSHDAFLSALSAFPPFSLSGQPTSSSSSPSLSSISRLSHRSLPLKPVDLRTTPPGGRGYPASLSWGRDRTYRSTESALLITPPSPSTLFVPSFPHEFSSFSSFSSTSSSE